MKAILLSIQPKWIAKILYGEKTIEIRKSYPKCDLPIDVYIYCTKDRNNKLVMDIDGWVGINPVPYCYGDKELNGKVVAKFTLNQCSMEFVKDLYKDACLTEEEIRNYLKGKPLYAWHIDNLVIFDIPKELKHFRKHCGKMFDVYSNCINCKAYKVDWDLGDWCKRSELTLTKAPQSYMFVEVEE